MTIVCTLSPARAWSDLLQDLAGVCLPLRC